MATKKQAKPADLPKTKSTYVRPSRSKVAIAERKAAKVALARVTGDWSKVTDADIAASLPAPHMIAADFALPSENRKTNYALVESVDTPFDVEAGVKDVFLQPETKAAVTAMERAGDIPADAEVVRSLADVDIAGGDDDDPFAEEAAAAKFAADGTDVSFDNSVTYYDRVLELEGEIADMKTAYAISLTAAQDATATAKENLAEGTRLLEKAKGDAEKYLRDLKSVRQMLAEADYLTLRQSDTISELPKGPPFWARVAAVFIDPIGKKRAR